jgi:transposase
MAKPLLTDAQWAKIEPLLPKRKARKKGGRPVADHRGCLEGILWVLKTGARWQDLPRDRGWPSYSTCRRRLLDWDEQGLWVAIWRAFLAELDAQGQLDWSESFADGSFAPAKKGAMPSEKPRKAREQSGWWWWTAKEFLWRTTWTRGPRTK